MNSHESSSWMVLETGGYALIEIVWLQEPAVARHALDIVMSTAPERPKFVFMPKSPCSLTVISTVKTAYKNLQICKSACLGSYVWSI